MNVHRRSIFGRLGVATLLATAGLASAVGVATSGGASHIRPHVTGHVLLVGTYKGHKGAYTTIQAAVNAAKPGDWILVAPGVYHEVNDMNNPPASTSLREGGFGSVLITTSGIHLRGMNRNTVVVDGTKSSATSACSANPSVQNFGPVVGGQQIGRNGIVVYRANNVSIENLKVCNFLAGSGDTGNGVWWNGGAGTGLIGLHGYSGAYLTATSSFFNGEQTASTYGIFSSDAAGPATWNTIYANNQNDSGMYVGACMQLCNITINKAWMENNALGYSGTNSGGAIVIKNSLFDKNEDGFDTNSAIGGDPPAPQNGACPNNGISPITHTHSCWVLMNNVFDSNNNPNTPRAGSAAAGPTGTGLTLSGGINDTIMNNVFKNNGAWGLLVVPYPDSGSPSFGQTCLGAGGKDWLGFCAFDPKNNSIKNNKFSNNGFFKNASNGDIGQITLFGGEPQNCFVGNTSLTGKALPGGTAPTNLQSAYSKCGVTTKAGNTGGSLFGQVLCDTGFGGCSGLTPPGVYPQPTGVKMAPLPAASKLVTMPNPCAGLPTNAWCKSGHPI